MVINKNLPPLSDTPEDHMKSLDQALDKHHEAIEQFLVNLPEGWEAIVFMFQQSGNNVHKVINAQTCGMDSTAATLIRFLVSLTQDQGLSIDGLVAAIHSMAKNEFGFKHEVHMVENKEEKKT